MATATKEASQRRQKALGSFYTPPRMAQVLTDWAIREPSDRVLDPSFGGLVFLDSASSRLRSMGARDVDGRVQIVGIDLDSEAVAAAHDRAGAHLEMELVERDFFEVSPRELGQFQAVVGNPPYVRYQEFNRSGAAARILSKEAGVSFTRLASSWAPFLVHASAFVAPGGRLAQVVPAELLHAQYAEPVVTFLRRTFGRLTVCAFDERVFPGALEEVVLLFAEDRGSEASEGIRLISSPSVDGVAAKLDTARHEPASRVRAVGDRLITQLLPEATQRLLSELEEQASVQPMGDLASVDIGIVTGANKFFVLTEEEAQDLHPDLLVPAVCKAAHVAGAVLTSNDLRGSLQKGQRGLLFLASASSKADALRTAHRRIEDGEAAGFDRRYKCRIREPWWALPAKANDAPDLLMTYCASAFPRLATNDARALNTNTLHGVRVLDKGLAPGSLAAGFFNSLTLLSAEVAGRSYGGGVLKLEPTEAEALLLPPIPPEIKRILPLVDEAIRSRDLNTAVELVDKETLVPLGLDQSQIALLREARARLQERRMQRGRAPVSS